MNDPDIGNAELIDQELSEILDYGGAPTRLSVTDAHEVLAILTEFERSFGENHGWEQDPVLYVMKGAVDSHGRVSAVILDPLPIHPVVWQRNDAGGVIAHLAQQMTNEGSRGLLLDACEPGPLIGCAIVCEGWVRDPASDPRVSVHDRPDLRLDETRYVQAIDLDERIYSVMRWRSTGRVSSDLSTPKGLQRAVDGWAGDQGTWFRQYHAEGLARAPRALRALVRALDEGTPL